MQEGKFGNTWRPLCLLALKMTVILDFLEQDLGVAAEGNSIRIGIRVLGLLAAHMQIYPPIMIHCRRVKYPLGN